MFRVATLRTALSSVVVLLAWCSIAVAASTTLVISEFRTRGVSGAADEFVEIYNLTGSPIDISGLLIRGSNNAAAISTRATIPAGTILGPGCHWLAANTGYVGSPAGDQTYATGIADDGGIALTQSNGTTIIDQVGMSAGSAYKEGTTLAPLTANVNVSYERNPGGVAGNGQDSDNNLADFHNQNPSAPQNRASLCIAATPALGTTWGQIKILYR
jgi:hypothetical protein